MILRRPPPTARLPAQRPTTNWPPARSGTNPLSGEGGPGGRSDYVLADTLAQARYSQVVDSEGRSIAADAQLRALELIGDRSQPRFTQIADRLANWLNDYSTPLLPAAQRRFLMLELLRLTGGAAGKWGPVHFSARNRLWRTDDRPKTWTCPSASAGSRGVSDVRGRRACGGLSRSRSAYRRKLATPQRACRRLAFASPGGRVVALLRTRSVLKRAADIIAADMLPAGVQVAVGPPEKEAGEGIAHLLPAGPKMPGWRLDLCAWRGATDPMRPSTGESPATSGSPCW